MKTAVIAGEPSWEIHSDCVSAALTRSGGQLGPVEFHFKNRSVSPFHLAPWAGEKAAKSLPPILRALRGDFFCMPFGGNASPWKSEVHPVHGETANNDWIFLSSFQRNNWAVLETELNTGIRKAHVDKCIALRAGDTAIYSRHTISESKGPMNLGHHAMLNFEAGGGRISTSPFVRGQVFPGPFENPSEGGYSSLKPGAFFKTLSKVPCSDGTMADLSRYPAREGYEDLVMLNSNPGTPFAWTAVTFESQGYLWFSLKDPKVLASTILWHSNGGRHYPPWNGRHRKVLGLEEVTSYFHSGLAESVKPNPVSKDGIPTVLELSPTQPLCVNVIMGVAEIPPGFNRVKAILRDNDGIKLLSSNGQSVFAKLDLGFLSNEEDTTAFL